jgi:flagellin
MEMAQKGINIAAENTQSAESRIRDTNMADEMVEYTKNQILSQSAMAMLAQANSQSQNVLSLLK